MVLCLEIILSERKIPGFLAKNQKILKVEKIRKYDEESVFSRKNVVIFLKAFFTKMGKRKICGSGPSHFYIISENGPKWCMSEFTARKFFVEISKQKRVSFFDCETDSPNVITETCETFHIVYGKYTYFLQSASKIFIKFPSCRHATPLNSYAHFEFF